MNVELFPEGFGNMTCVILLGCIDIILLTMLGDIEDLVDAGRDCQSLLGKEMQLGWALDLLSWPHPPCLLCQECP